MIKNESKESCKTKENDTELDGIQWIWLRKKVKRVKKSVKNG